ncbi:MAG TPA: hypothetical protein ENK35_03610 [Candidatus Tenderia sp.]|nr:hypothetical protein [Candidatus Tenderia sp.]
MEHNTSTEKWLWRMYREVAQYVHNPSAANEVELLNLVSQYRKEAEQQNKTASDDEHEWAMNFR